MRDALLRYIDAHSCELIDFTASLIREKPVTPNYAPDGTLSEINVQKRISQKLEALGCEIHEIPVDFGALKAYANKPGYRPGVTDVVSFEGRNNLLARLPGSDPEHAHAVMLGGHCDVVGVPDAPLWKYPPFEGLVREGCLHGRGSSDMLGGLAGALMAMEALCATGLRPRGDIWFDSVVSEEFGGTGTLATAEWMRLHGVHPEIVVMGEGTDADKLALVCRAIAFADLTVPGRAGHLERTPGDFRKGEAVDAIAKARYVMDAIDRLNLDWAAREDKDHPLLNDPCQVKVSMIRGGQHPSGYAEQCVLSLDIQTLPHEQDENNLPTAMRREFEAYLRRVCDADPWLCEHPVQIDWKLDADCDEVPADHPFVEKLLNAVREVNGHGRLYGKTGHIDGGWYHALNGAPCLAFGPGTSRGAHCRDEKCPVDRIVAYAKALALCCLDWCNQDKA